jgi:16S rRNA (adenine1518-N6/adenine1519-N6)-dimethyltransferase
MTEFFDWVNQKDQVIGATSREDAHALDLFHRAVHIYAFGETGGLWLQQRSHDKDLEPGLWTVSCSGHVDRGEDYLSASVREFSEELGIAISADELEHIFYSSPCKETGYEFITSFKLSRPIHPIPSETEVLEVREVQLQDLKSWIVKEPEQFSSSFRFLLPQIWERLL